LVEILRFGLLWDVGGLNGEGDGHGTDVSEVEVGREAARSVACVMK
jgi:hypothetical protein